LGGKKPINKPQPIAKTFESPMDDHIEELIGHADLQVLRRYLAQTNQDAEQAHRNAGPVDMRNHIPVTAR
jgi:hypothetical protein